MSPCVCGRHAPLASGFPTTPRRLWSPWCPPLAEITSRPLPPRPPGSPPDFSSFLDPRFLRRGSAALGRTPASPLLCWVGTDGGGLGPCSLVHMEVVCPCVLCSVRASFPGRRVLGSWDGSCPQEHCPLAHLQSKARAPVVSEKQTVPQSPPPGLPHLSSETAPLPRQPGPSPPQALQNPPTPCMWVPRLTSRSARPLPAPGAPPGPGVEQPRVGAGGLRARVGGAVSAIRGERLAAGPGRKLTSRVPLGGQPCPVYKYTLLPGQPTCIPAPRRAAPSQRKEDSRRPSAPGPAVTPGEWERARCRVSSGPAAPDCYLSALADLPRPRLHLALGRLPVPAAFLGPRGCTYAGPVPGE